MTCLNSEKAREQERDALYLAQAGTVGSALYLSGSALAAPYLSGRHSPFLAV